MRNVNAPLAGGQLPHASSAASARDVVKYGLEQWTVLAENDEVRVLRALDDLDCVLVELKR